MSTTRQRYGSVHEQGRRGWKTFLRPGWVFMFLAIIAFSYAAFSFLAPWQLNKDDEIVERNRQIDAAFQVDPVPAEEVFDSRGAITPEEEWARVVLEGRYLPGDEVLLRNRPVDSSPAFHALTPFELNSGEVILVNRGFNPPLEGGVPPMEPAPSGELSILGHARLSEQTPMSAPIEDQGHRQVYGIDTAQIGEVTGVDLAEDYVQLADGEAGELNAIPVPKLDRGSHLSYGFQWIAFGIMAPLGLGYFVWAEFRERRRVRAEEQELVDAPAQPAEPAGGAEEDAPRGGRERYGAARPDHYGRRAKRERERF